MTPYEELQAKNRDQENRHFLIGVAIFIFSVLFIALLFVVNAEWARDQEVEMHGMSHDIQRDRWKYNTENNLRWGD